MNLILQSVFCLHILPFYFVLAKTFPPYSGDVPLQDYLKDYCDSITTTTTRANMAAKQKEPKNIFIIENLHLDSVDFFADNFGSKQVKQKKKQNTPKCLNFNEFLFDIDCEYVFFANLTLTELKKELESDDYSRLLVKGVKLQLVFDFCRTTSLTSVTFYSIISPLAELYAQHHHLLPFIVLLNERVSRLHQWASVVFGYFPVFRAILTSSLNDTTNNPTRTHALHIRPVLDGCALQENSILLPKSSADFDRLRVPFQRCNFKQAQLNVSVNNVSMFFSYE